MSKTQVNNLLNKDNDNDKASQAKLIDLKDE